MEMYHTVLISSLLSIIDDRLKERLGWYSTLLKIKPSLFWKNFARLIYANSTNICVDTKFHKY